MARKSMSRCKANSRSNRHQADARKSGRKQRKEGICTIDVIFDTFDEPAVPLRISQTLQ